MNSIACAASAAVTIVRFAGAAHHAVGDIGRDAVVEQHDVLAHERDVRAQARERERLEIVAVEQDAPARRPVEARHQVGERGLAAAGGADQRDGFRRIDRERNALRAPGGRAFAYVKLTLSKRIAPSTRADRRRGRGRSPPAGL